MCNVISLQFFLCNENMLEIILCYFSNTIVTDRYLQSNKQQYIGSVFYLIIYK